MLAVVHAFARLLSHPRNLLGAGRLSCAHSVTSRTEDVHSAVRPMARRLIPLLDRVLVQKVEAPSKSVGGILLPDTASKVCQQPRDCPSIR